MGETSARTQLIQEVKENKIIAILRGVEAERCADTARALLTGGIRMVEVTFNQREGAEQYRSTIEGIKSVARCLGGKMRVGAGTVLTLEQLRLAYEAGAEYIITPNTDESIIRAAVELGLVAIPGAFTPSEICRAYEAGADFVKVFPASAMGADYFKALRGPLGHIPLMAVGGISEENGNEFLKAGATALGIGGNLVDRKMIEREEFDGITRVAERYVRMTVPGDKNLVH